MTAPITSFGAEPIWEPAGFIRAEQSERRFVTKVKKMAEKYPDEVEVLRENPDGSIYAKMPVRALHLNLVKRKISDEQRAEAAERLRNWRETAKQKN